MIHLSFAFKLFLCVSFIWSDELVSTIVAYLKNFQVNGINNLVNDNTYLIPAITIIGFVLFILVLKCCLSYRKSSDEEKKQDKNKKAKWIKNKKILCGKKYVHLIRIQTANNSYNSELLIQSFRMISLIDPEHFNSQRFASMWKNNDNYLLVISLTLNILKCIFNFIYKTMVKRVLLSCRHSTIKLSHWNRIE